MAWLHLKELESLCTLWGRWVSSRYLPTACVCKGVKELCQVPFLVEGTDLANDSCAGKRGILPSPQSTLCRTYAISGGFPSSGGSSVCSPCAQVPPEVLSLGLLLAAFLLFLFYSAFKGLNSEKGLWLFQTAYRKWTSWMVCLPAHRFSGISKACLDYGFASFLAITSQPSKAFPYRRRAMVCCGACSWLINMSWDAPGWDGLFRRSICFLFFSLGVWFLGTLGVLRSRTSYGQVETAQMSYALLYCS